ncbi:YebF family protein [Dickeya fangzhongdai]|uniref:YebF family protein n=1 Tax=Dickeya fangzhongdai TaxID=1778540 RepID=UPI00130086EB|nr:YebF family protein [Dickeya fangzhongdai]WES90709.1 YebF family protein [Dickeya fangzhongdai]WOY02140.1 YebF family protein [Dickeya fangzhongdai]WOY02664.1 YebF family protein [Dickeya fangzhongdai]
MGWKKKITLCFLVTVGALSAYEYAIWFTGPSCNEITYEQVIASVKKDLSQPPMSRWHLLQPSNLGTSAPTIQFSQHPESVSSDTYLVAFQVSGPLKTHQLFAIYECATGAIEYSVKN